MKIFIACLFKGGQEQFFSPSDTLIYGISRDGSKTFNIRTFEHMILGQLTMGARQTKNALLYKHKNQIKTTTESLTTACITPWSILPRVTKISIFMLVILLSDHDHHICLLSYLSLIHARYRHDN